MDTYIKRVGIFDSGIGGRSVESELKLLAKTGGLDVCVDYLADTENFPYGPKTQDELQMIIRKNIEYLLARGNSNIIVACNTASIAGGSIYHELSNEYNISILKVTSGIQLAHSDLRNTKKILVIGSEYTINSQYYNSELKKINAQLHVIELPMQDFIAYIELGKNNMIAQEMKRIKSVMLENEIDAILLGCTHFSFIKNDFYTLFPGIKVFDPSSLIAQLFVEHIEKRGRSFHTSTDQKIVSSYAINSSRQLYSNE